MKRVDEYITEKDVKDFCRNCNELCSRHCIISLYGVKLRINIMKMKEKGEKKNEE